MRKTRDRKWTKNKPRSIALHPTTDTWRDLYQKMKFPSLLGQLQDDTQIRFMTDGPPLSGSVRSYEDGQEEAFGDFETEDDLKDTWRSILTCAKSVEQQLTGNGQADRKPFLSTVLTFISNACALPRPEECFGTNHVMIEELSTSFVTILHEAEKAQEAVAKLRDKIYNSAAEGVDSDALLKLIDAEFDPIPLRLHEVDMLRSYQKIIVEWEGRVTSMLDHDDDEVFNPESGNTLQAAEMLKEESKSHGYISKASVQLDTRIRKAHDLRSRIRRWKKSCQGDSLGSTKTLNGLVKEAYRVKLIFKEVSEIIETHSKIEAWIDRADVALRSRISSSEIKELLLRSKDLSVNLSEYEEKLHSRASSADEWWSSLKEVMQVPIAEDGEVDLLGLMNNFQRLLVEGAHGQLHDLALEGSRIPVDVDGVKLLQVAMDAKAWTSKAEKWIPTCEDSRKGKLSDVREHADKALELRDRLPLPETQKEAWILQGEKELDDIVEAADGWYEKVRFPSVFVVAFECSICLSLTCPRLVSFVVRSILGG
jgi:PLU-1-like protein